MTRPHVEALTRAPALGGRAAHAATIVLILAAAAGFAHTLRVEPERAWGNLLIADFYFVALALGALFFIALQYLVTAGWWTAVRRVPESLASALPWVAVPMLALYVGRHHLYHWSHPGHDPILEGKAAYLNVPAFAGRLVVILCIWAVFSRLLVRSGRAGQPDPASERRRRMRRSAIFIVIFAITFSVASFDWLMSLEPHWFSTIFAVYAFAGLFQAAIAAIILGVVLLRPRLERAGLLRTEHVHDLGKLLFAFSTFWAYIWLSQYLLIWYSHLPEEITHYIARTRAPWGTWFYANLVLNWVVPFLVLMPRASKRDWRILAAVAGVVLVGRWVDLFVHVMPALGLEPRIGLAELLVFTGFLALFIAVCRWHLERRPLADPADPFLHESLTYHV